MGKEQPSLKTAGENRVCFTELAPGKVLLEVPFLWASTVPKKEENNLPPCPRWHLATLWSPDSTGLAPVHFLTIRFLIIWLHKSC